MTNAVRLLAVAAAVLLAADSCIQPLQARPQPAQNAITRPSATEGAAGAAKFVNLEAILTNDRILGSYIRCLMDEAPCTKAGTNLKLVLPDAIQTDCSRCTAQQKQNSRKVITFFRVRRPQDWQRLTRKYDPRGQGVKSLGLH